MQHNPIELIKKLTAHYESFIDRPFYIYLVPNSPNVVYAIGVEPTYKHHINLSVDQSDMEKNTDQVFEAIKSFIETNQLI